MMCWWPHTEEALMFPSVVPHTHSAFPSLDVDECKERDTCGANATCFNTIGSYYCTCNSGFALKSGASSFTETGQLCEGEAKTKEIRNNKNNSVVIFGYLVLLPVFCLNMFFCLTNTCNPHRFDSFADSCSINKTICGNGTCHPRPDGHLCACHKGFTNYANHGAKCICEHKATQLFRLFQAPGNAGFSNTLTIIIPRGLKLIKTLSSALDCDVFVEHEKKV